LANAPCPESYPERLHLFSVFTWNIDRVIVQYNDFLALRWYSLFFAVGFVISYFQFQAWFKKEGKPVEVIDTLLVYIVVGCIVGARLGHVLFYDPIYYSNHLIEVLQINKGGLASHGGFFGVIAAMALFCKFNPKISFFWLSDRVAISAIMTGGFIRVGNFFNSEIIGRQTDVPWAVIFEKIDQVPRHPAQLYEAAFYFALSGFLYFLYRKWDRKVLEGRFFGLVFLIGYAFRFYIEYFKENQVSWEAGMALNMGQILSLACIPLGIFLARGMHHRYAIFQRGLSPDGYGGGYNDPQFTAKEAPNKHEPKTGKKHKRPNKKR